METQEHKMPHICSQMEKRCTLCLFIPCAQGCSTFCHLMSFLSQNLLSSISHSICAVISVCLLSVCHLVVHADLSPYYITLGLSPSWTLSPLRTPLCIPTSHSLVHSLSIFHRFNRMHLGHTSILCNLYHLGAKLRQSERLMARQINTHSTGCSIQKKKRRQPSLPML